MKLKTFECEHCHTKFDRRNGKRVYRFCSRSCAQQVIAPMSRGYRPLIQKWIIEHGKDRAIEMMAEHMQKRSDVTTSNNIGRIPTTKQRQKQSIANLGRSNVLKGKTFEEFYGLERAQQLANEHSRKLKEGFASGRLKPTARSKSAPVFRGVKLRSKLEQRAIEFLEQRDGLIFGQTLLYEDPVTYVQWHSANGKQHTYIPDLYDTVNDVVYEVKPAWCVKKPSSEMQKKFAALVASGKQCAYLTDKDVR